MRMIALADGRRAARLPLGLRQVPLAALIGCYTTLPCIQGGVAAQIFTPTDYLAQLFLNAAASSVLAPGLDGVSLADDQ